MYTPSRGLIGFRNSFSHHDFRLRHHDFGGQNSEEGRCSITGSCAKARTTGGRINGVLVSMTPGKTLRLRLVQFARSITDVCLLIECRCIRIREGQIVGLHSRDNG